MKCDCPVAHGCPLAFYADKHGVFHVNAKDAQSGDGKTEFGRVVERLAIELIAAHTPQAKGRVERSNQTLQDRLIKEMRLRGISDMQAASAYAPAFIAFWNARFARPPRKPEDAHRPWIAGIEALDEALARREERRLSKALNFSAGGALWCVRTSGPGIAMRGATITLLHYANGEMKARYKDRPLAFTRIRGLPTPDPGEDEKTIDARLDAIIAVQSAKARTTGSSGRGQRAG